MARPEGISIHVPLAGNVENRFYLFGGRDISIHVPLAGNVTSRTSAKLLKRHFYPRSPCGERPDGHPPENVGAEFLSTFPLRGTSCYFNIFVVYRTISIHVPLAGNVDEKLRVDVIPKLISIHVPLAGNVLQAQALVLLFKHFYPRSPCGERLVPAVVEPMAKIFLSTFPLRGTSIKNKSSRPPTKISIHVPLAGNVV